MTTESESTLSVREEDERYLRRFGIIVGSVIAAAILAISAAIFWPSAGANEANLSTWTTDHAAELEQAAIDLAAYDTAGYMAQLHMEGFPEAASFYRDEAIGWCYDANAYLHTADVFLLSDIPSEWQGYVARRAEGYSACTAGDFELSSTLIGYEIEYERFLRGVES